MGGNHNVDQSVAVYEIFAKEVKFQSLSLKVKVKVKKENGTCSILLGMFESMRMHFKKNF